MLSDVAMLAARTERTLAYISALRDAELLPARLILIESESSRAKPDILSLAMDAKIDVARVFADDINAPNVVAVVAALRQTYVIFSGPGGAIVRKPLFETGKKFIHVHPGRLPAFRGSTTIYYSLLAENCVEATAMLLDEAIDCGPVIGHAEFDPPSDRREIDTSYDQTIRAKLLVSVMDRLARDGKFSAIEQPAETERAETYYIIHPVLKHLAILAS